MVEQEIRLNLEPLPWMTHPFIEFISKKINKETTIFEFGSGSSTLFFAKKVKKIISIETRKNWYEAIKHAALDNVEIILMEDAIANENYENFPKNYNEKFDFIIVDSIKRFACCKNSIECLKLGGSTILDDSERKNYKKIFDFFKEKNFKQIDFFGTSAHDNKTKNTTMFFQ
jgi:tRNA A58 N-methylase Trm61